jgi:hypothetical protein
MKFHDTRLHAPSGSLQELEDFYLGQLGLETAGERTSAKVGETRVVFTTGPGEPFYHFAFLVPGNRFDEALDWIGERAELLPDAETGGVVFDFDNWNALACYFHDPVGNIVELIAHRGVEESGAEGPFTAAELVGVSELGLVGDKAEMAAALHRDLGLAQWAGDIDHEASLAFVGQKARTLILSSEGRGWLPTGRPAEAHHCDVELSEIRPGETHIGHTRYRIRSA